MTERERNAAPAPRALEAIFRGEWGQLIATAARLLGDLDRAEETVQEVIVSALERWPFTGVPERPGAWLLVATRNRALDRLRGERVRRERRPLLVTQARLDQAANAAAASSPTDEEGDLSGRQIGDDRLRLIFTCCHPILPRESQVALTLRLLGGLSTREIAAALLVSEGALAQRIVRAKKTLRERRVPYRAPSASELPMRLPEVLEVLYLIFNEGYAAHEGEDRLRPQLCEEALRLTRTLGELLPEAGEVRALVCLMELHRAREAGRVDADGAVVLLEDQDRSRWDQVAIARTVREIERLASGEVGPYLLQAAIAACHARAPDFASTDWRTIVALYDRLHAEWPSPVVALNRAVAVGMASGPAVALPQVEALAADERLRSYAPLEAARADLLRRLERFDDAAAAYERALESTRNLRERRILEARLEECRGRRGSA